MDDRERKDGLLPDSLELETGGQDLSRRELLMRAGAFGITIAIPAGIVSEGAQAAEVADAEPLKSFTAAQAVTLSAIVARLIPKDENGPGAVEAGVPRYIDRLLRSDQNTYHGPNNPDQNLTDAYAAGLKAVDSYAQETHSAAFASLSPDNQDAILSAMQTNHASGFTPDSRTFFNLIREHAVNGMFGDPYYGGNINFAGWDLIGYPGIRLGFTEDEQQLGIEVKRVHKGALDYSVFADSRKGM